MSFTKRAIVWIMLGFALMFLGLYPWVVAAQEQPQMTPQKLYMLLGQAQATIALQQEYIAQLEKQIGDLKAEAAKQKAQ